MTQSPTLFHVLPDLWKIGLKGGACCIIKEFHLNYGFHFLTFFGDKLHSFFSLFGSRMTKNRIGNFFWWQFQIDPHWWVKNYSLLKKLIDSFPEWKKWSYQSIINKIKRKHKSLWFFPGIAMIAVNWVSVGRKNSRKKSFWRETNHITDQHPAIQPVSGLESYYCKK